MNSSKKTLASKRRGTRSRSKYTSHKDTQTSIPHSEISRDSSESVLAPSLTVSTLDQHWVKHEDYVKAMVELENRKMVGQAMYDYIVSNELHYQSITLMALLKNWKNI